MTQIEQMHKMLGEIRTLAMQSAPHGRAMMIANRADKIGASLRRMQRRDGRLTLTRVQVCRPGEQTGAEVRGAYDKRATDRQTILSILESGKGLTTAEAIDLGILRAGARIFELRKKGYQIKTEMIKSGADRIAKYTLIN